MLEDISTQPVEFKPPQDGPEPLLAESTQPENQSDEGHEVHIPISDNNELQANEDEVASDEPVETVEQPQPDEPENLDNSLTPIQTDQESEDGTWELEKAHTLGLVANKKGYLESNVKGYERSPEETKERMDKVLSPYKELYDTNPAIFANMPTSEFMVIGEELAEIDEDLKWLEEDIRETHHITSDFNEDYNHGSGWYHQAARNIIQRLAANADPNMNDEAVDGVGDEVDKIFEGSFDKTPHQVMDALRVIVDKYSTKVMERKPATEARRADFLNKYKPTSQA